ncbi:hypothetical protein F5X99DRAFT_393779 [Biscogniauxia marginata]|nr:hypothetical protein F5X99DRAFT_393779 [Biscogniauxia marginata]
MSKPQLLKEMPLGKGCKIGLYMDPEAPIDSIDRFWSEVEYDGKPDSDLFTIPKHWHKYHDEIFVLKKGRGAVTVEGKTTILEAGGEPLLIPRWNVHSFTSFKGEAMTLKERTDPTGEHKALFFNDLYSQGVVIGLLHMLRTFFDGDTYPSLPGNIKIVDQAFMSVFGVLAKLVAVSDRKPISLVL